MQLTRLVNLLAPILVVGSAAGLYAEHASPPKVKLVLQVTVDGLRADLLSRYGESFGEGGFRYLSEHGTVFTNAHYQHANTETIVGHTTLATGASPSRHGMVGNVWLNRASGELAYNIEDARYPLLPTRGEEVTAAQLDPTQRLSRSTGRSPRAILAPTLADTLAAFYGGRSKIFAVSGKDRGAVSMAGHAGKAFWFSTDTGDFVTSRYYYDKYPAWVVQWNKLRKAEGYAGKSWSLTDEPETYLLRGQDDRPYEADLNGYGRVFPHPFGELDDKLFLTRLFVSPVGDRLTLDFALTLLAHEQIGRDEVPDYLAISFSSVDAVNHFFGPSSLENEEVVRQVDRHLRELFAQIDRSIGLEHTLVVLSADHGMADMPEYMSELGCRVGRIEPENIVAVANRAGREKFGIDSVVKEFFRPYLYLDSQKIGAAKVDPRQVERTIAARLTKVEGIEIAVPRSVLSALQADDVQQKVWRNHHAERSGDIYLVQRPYWFLFEKGPIAVMHGSPWRYDTHVPILFCGAGVPHRRVDRLVHPGDVAPTIAAFLGMTAPGSAQGKPLGEVLP